MDELESALLDVGGGGVHSRRHTVPLEQIKDDEQRFHVLKARVERLEALWSINQRKRETRGKIIIGGALLAEAADEMTEGESELLQRLVDIIDRRVERVRTALRCASCSAMFPCLCDRAARSKRASRRP